MGSLLNQCPCRWAFLLALTLGHATLAAPTALTKLGLPASPRAILYPLDARRDGHPFDPAEVIGFCGDHGLNMVAATVAPGPACEDARLLLKAAAAAHLPVALEPLPGDDAAAVSDLLTELGEPAPTAWIIPATAAPVAAALRQARPGSALLGTFAGDDAAAAHGVVDALWCVRPALLQPGLTYGEWSRTVERQRASFGGPVLAQVECAPPDWFVAAGCLRSAAPAFDLFPDARLRPASVLALAGDYLLVPEPAQIRLQTYAAVGRGACGVIFTGAGHLFPGGAEPRANTDRATAVTLLTAELATFEPFLAEGEVADGPAPQDSLSVGVLALGPRRLALLWRDSFECTCAVPAGLLMGLRVDVPCSPAPARVDTLGPAAVDPGNVDQREAGIRLPLRTLDLTAAATMGPAGGEHAAWLEAVDARLAAALPMTATRARILASSRFAKVSASIDRLVALHAAQGGEELAQARGLLDDAGLAVNWGYARSALDLSMEAERALRAASERERRGPAQTDPPPGRPAWARLCLATLPALYAPWPTASPDPLPLPLSANYAELAAGAMPPHWQALRGFDQTVATLTGGGGTLGWTPAGSDPGALYLPFVPAAGLRGTILLTVRAAPRGNRMLLLAAGAGQPPVGGVVFGPDGSVQPLGADQPLGPWRVGTPLRLDFRLAAGKLTWSLDRAAPSAAQPVAGRLGAVLLAKPGGDDPTTIAIQSISIEKTD